MCSENEKPDRLIRMLYDIADDAEAPANSRLSAIKEILDRTVGKGVMLGGEQTVARQAAAKATVSCSMPCGLRCAIRVRGSSCCDGPCRSWSARLYRRLCGCIRSALPNTR